MKINRKNGFILISNNEYEVHIHPKIFGGYYLKKYVKDSPFEMLEMREIRVHISEEDVLEIAKDLLYQVYRSTNKFKNIRILPT